MNRAIIDAPSDLSERLDRLTKELDEAGVLTDPAWRAALHAVPRHLFVPTQAWVGHGSEHVEVDRDRDPKAWWHAVYAADEAIVTQFDDRPGPPDSHAEPSSSCPAPTVQFRLLHELHVSDGMRVLEIGTGTGWNAALLAHRLGDSNVTTVEIDPDITRQAIRSLAAAGRHPTVDIADGRLGHPRGAPYDRIIATCAVTEIPYPWVTQTRPGGIILSPWMPRARLGGNPLARLVVNDDGTASGRFVSNVSFMQLRQQRRSDDGLPPSLRDDPPTQTATSTTTTDPVTALFRNQHAAFPARLLLGDGTCARPDQTT